MHPWMLSTTCSPRLLHGTIEPVYKGTLVYAREHNPTLMAVYELKGAPRVCKNIDLPVSSI